MEEMEEMEKMEKMMLFVCGLRNAQAKLCLE